MIDRAKFFAAVRASVFGGFMSQDTVNGITAILDEWDRHRLTDLRWLAYMLATVRRECGVRMLPVREGFAKTDAEARAFVARQRYKYAAEENGQVYYGRGLVQLTWAANYKKMGDLLKIDLLHNPDLALLPDVASKIMFEGMIRGSFTGKSLALYFNDNGEDWKNARRIINGMDHADEIAETAKAFHAALKGAYTAPPRKGEIRQPPAQPAPAAKVGWLGALLNLFKRSA